MLKIIGCVGVIVGILGGVAAAGFSKAEHRQRAKAGQLSERLREQENRFMESTNAAGELQVKLDEAGRTIESANAELEKLRGATAANQGYIAGLQRQIEALTPPEKPTPGPVNWAAINARNMQIATAQAEVQRKAWDEQARINAQRAKDEAVEAERQFQLRLQAQVVDAETLKAQAAMRQADADMMKAQYPGPGVIIQNVNQQNQQNQQNQRQPGGYNYFWQR